MFIVHTPLWAAARLAKRVATVKDFMLAELNKASVNFLTDEGHDGRDDTLI
jgi:hypothetical protein